MEPTFPFVTEFVPLYHADHGWMDMTRIESSKVAVK